MTSLDREQNLAGISQHPVNTQGWYPVLVQLPDSLDQACSREHLCDRLDRHPLEQWHELATGVLVALTRPSIVVINSWRAVVELGRGPFVADPKETERFEGARLDIEYSDGPAMCLVADLSRLLRLRRWRVQPEKPFDVVLADGLLLVGVEEMTVERAAAIVSENPEFRRMADGTLGSPEDAARKLLGQAHVRALVRFDVQIADTEGGLIIPVPDDSTT